MKTCESEAARRRSCRLGPHWVTVGSRAGRVTSVELGARGSRDDRSLARDLESALRGDRVPEHLHVDTSGLSAFTRKVLGSCAGIRPGRVMTYSGLAKAVGRPRAARAVGQVLANNPFALLIPCHRVVGADYSLHGFGGGLQVKEWLLAKEGWEFEGSGRARRLKSEAKSQAPEAKRRRPKREARARSG